MKILRRVLRGPASCALLKRLGVDPKRYWLLVDLFGKLSDRGEMMDQLGRDDVGLKVIAVVYGVITAFLTLAMVATHLGPPAYFALFLVFTSALLLSLLLSEAGNSLVNPTEAHILAHQPINGATYVASKLTHLVRILLYLVPAMNGIPAFAGLLLKDAPLFYPLIHLAAAFSAGAVSALLCCAMYGWLIRLMPVRRLKAAAQLAGMMPFLGVMWLKHVVNLGAQILAWVPADPAARWALGATAVAAAITIAALGVRSLSGDYLIRVSGMMRGGRVAAVRSRRKGGISLIARLFGGQPGRAGYAFVSRMMLRDFQFRRQVLPMMVMVLVGMVPSAVMAGRADPFSGRMTAMHGVPHVIAFLLFVMCVVLPFGNDYKGAWVFLAAPAHTFRGFARGVYGAMCVPLIVAPHAIMLPLLAVVWGPLHAVVFVAYSAAVSFLYLSLELRLIDGPPFCRQMDPTRGAVMLPMLILSAAIMGVAVAVQLFFVFPSLTRVGLATVVAGAVAWFLTRSSLSALETSIRHNLGLVSAESGTLYVEVNS